MVLFWDPGTVDASNLSCPGVCALNLSAAVIGIDDFCGTGVIVGFMGAAYLAILIAIGYYLFCLDSPDMNPLDLSLVSSFRALLLKHTPWLLPTTDRKRARLERVLAEANLAMCDLQSLTGIGILVAGWISLYRPTLLLGSHWQMLTYLAWFATLTHLSGLTVLQQYLRVHPAERVFRILVMGTLLVMLIISIIPMAFVTDVNWSTYACPAGCFFRPQFISDLLITTESWGFLFKGVVFNVYQMQIALTSATTCLLLFNFVVRVVKLIPPAREYIQRRVRGSLTRSFQNFLRKQHEFQFCSPWRRIVWLGLVVKPLSAIFLCSRGYLTILASFAAEIFWVLFLSLFGSIKLISTQLSFYEGPDPTEPYQGGHWAFGQVLPVFLLLAPTVGVLRPLLQSVREPSDEETETVQEYDVVSTNSPDDSNHAHTALQNTQLVSSPHAAGSNDEHQTHKVPSFIQLLDDKEFYKSSIFLHVKIWIFLKALGLGALFLYLIFYSRLKKTNGFTDGTSNTVLVQVAWVYPGILFILAPLVLTTDMLFAMSIRDTDLPQRTRLAIRIIAPVVIAGTYTAATTMWLLTGNNSLWDSLYTNIFTMFFAGNGVLASLAISIFLGGVLIHFCGELVSLIFKSNAGCQRGAFDESLGSGV